MNFFKRALASVTRRKGKSIILFAVVFILGNVIAGAISIQQATESVEKNIKGQLGGKATIVMDHEKFDKERENNENLDWPGPVSVKDIEAIGSLPYVKYYDYTMNNHQGVIKLKTYQDEEMGTSHGSSGINKNVNIKGVNYPGLVDIEEQKIKLTAGRVFEEQEIKDGKAVALISDKMAELNNVGVGDTLVVDASESTENWGIMEREAEDGSEEKPEVKIFTQNQPYEVVGIFSVVKDDAPKEKKDESKVWDEKYRNQETLNTIYTSNGALLENTNNFIKGLIKEIPEMKDIFTNPETGEVQERQADYSPMVVIKSPEEGEAFRAEASALLTSQFYKILLSTDQYDSIAGPIKGMSKIATYVIIVAVGATLLIISLVVLLFLRDRKHELGVYLSLGEQRGKVIGQILIEVMLIAFVAISLSVFTGNFLAKAVSSSLVETQLEAQAENNNNGMNEEEWNLSQLTGDKVSTEDVAHSYTISLTPGYILVFYVVGLGTILLSTVVPLIYILRLNPKKIMM